MVNQANCQERVFIVQLILRQMCPSVDHNQKKKNVCTYINEDPSPIDQTTLCVLFRFSVVLVVDGLLCVVDEDGLRVNVTQEQITLPRTLRREERFRIMHFKSTSIQPFSSLRDLFFEKITRLSWLRTRKKTPTVSYRIIFVFLSRLDIALLFT